MNVSSLRNKILLLSISGLTIVGCSHFSKHKATRVPQSQSANAFATLRNSFQTLLNPQETPEPLAIRLAKTWVVDPGPNGEFITTIQEIDERKLQTGAPEKQPWSGDYWPDRIGGVAVRYSKGSRALGMAYGANRANRRTLRRNERAQNRLDDLSTEKIALLSPAEKYDILIGDHEFNFTQQVMNGIKTNQETFGSMPMWNGICDGWSPSSFLLERPRRAVAVQSVHGKTVTFYPDDIKALASHLFARGFVSESTFFLDSGKKPEEQAPDRVNYGIRCDVEKPKTDANGSVLPLTDFIRAPNECSDDVNPAVWHLGIVNRMGVQKLTFVVDKDFNSPVNNHPLGSYNYHYFNPSTGKHGSSVESIVPIAQYEGDPYKSRRSKDAAFVVGVEMTMKYLGNIKARIKAADDESQDNVKDWKITYDLELDRDQRIIGGEWRLTDGKNAYPDFMWYQRAWVWANGDPVFGDEWKEAAPPAHWAKRSTDGDENFPFDRPTQVNNNGFIGFSRGQGLMERADHAVLSDHYLRIEAYQQGRKYMKACFQYCKDAYLNGNADAKAALAPLEAQLTSIHRRMDDAGVPKAVGAAFTRTPYWTLSQRAYDPALKDKTLKQKAINASYEYDRVCKKYCDLAYNGKAKDEQERNDALARMKVVDDELSRYQDHLDAYGIPTSKSYAQPLAKVIYKLIDLSNDPNARHDVYLPRGEANRDETPANYGDQGTQ